MNGDPKILVVGGKEGLVWGCFAGKLKEQRILIGWCEPWHLNGIPAGCSGVMVIKEFASHGLFDKAKVMADKAGLPFAAVAKQWAKAHQLLDGIRFYERVHAVKVATTAPPPVRLVEVATPAVVAEIATALEAPVQIPQTEPPPTPPASVDDLCQRIERLEAQVATLSQKKAAADLHAFMSLIQSMGLRVVIDKR